MKFLFLKSLLFSIMVPGTVAFLLPYHLVQGQQMVNLWLFLPGALIMCFGLTIYSWCVWDFARYGKGTPAPIDAPKHLVVRGLYRYTRNPMYISVLLIIFSWGLLFGDIRVFGYCLLVAGCFQFFVSGYEEPKLLQLFGAEYKNYISMVNRWLPWF